MDETSTARLIASLEMSAEVFREFIEEIPAGETGVKRDPKAWSIRHHVYHLADVQKLFHQRLGKFLGEESPVITPFIPGKDDTGGPGYTSVPEALSVFRDMRRKQIDIIKSMKGADLRKEGNHPEYRKYTLPILVRHILMHDYWHMYRIEELWLTRDEFLSMD